jgi:hypothetical protein
LEHRCRRAGLVRPHVPVRGSFPSFAGAALLGKGYAPLWRSLMSERSNSAKAPMMESMRLAMAGVLAGEDQALFDELHPDALAGQTLDQGA